MYRLAFWLLTRMDPETAHHVGFATIRWVYKIPGLRGLTWNYANASKENLAIEAFGLKFASPLGLAAGFDKNAQSPDGMMMLGFSSVEVGTVTALAQQGNPKPRMFRLKKDRALINRMGFNNHGAAIAAYELEKRALALHPDRHHGVLGINIGKSKVAEESKAIADYQTSTQLLAQFADYFVVNVSSPNTPGLRDLQNIEKLRPLLVAVREALDEVAAEEKTKKGRVPLLVKIAPDLADEDIDAIADLAVELGMDGIIATNTTIGREGISLSPSEIETIGMGGLSGAPLKQRALDVTARLYKRVGTQVTIVSVGGIETAEDAWQRITAGATLVQAYTGFVYGGPAFARKIHQGLAQKLQNGGFASLGEAVGSADR